MFAAKEKTINSLAGANIKPLVATPGVFYSLSAEDQRLIQMTADPNWACRFGNKESNASVILRFDDSKRNLETANWTLNVTYTIKLYGTAPIPYITYTGEVATIAYNTASSYNDIFLKSYQGALKAEVTITNVTWASTSGGPSIPAKYANDIYFDVTQETERYYNIAYNGYNCTAATAPAPIVSTSIPAATVNQSTLPNNQLPIAWSYIAGAESYDVEWLFVDIGAGIYASSYDLDFSRATRVNVTGQNFNIPMAYPKGVLVYRVRGVGNSHIAPFVNRVEGPWSADGLTNLTATSSNGSSFLKNYDGLDHDYNWQYSAAFAEDGKSKEVISYFDGSLRNRQTVTVLNSDNNAVIAETKYDFQGRPAVQILPTPLANGGIKFYSNFNAGFSKEQFDINSNYPLTGGAIATIPATSGAGAYYGNNTSASGSDAYVPDAQGFPYTQTKFKTDGTGRIVAQSGVGPTHKLGSSHDTKYIYGTPGGQEELDRLFGNEAGNIRHYKKNVMVDANEQCSVTYLDQEGRTIASALSGPTPKNLLDLDNKPAPVHMLSDMLTGKNELSGNSKIATTVFVTTKQNTPYTFTYSLNIAPDYHDTTCYAYLLDPFSPSAVCKICSDCIYDLEIKITDSEGNNLAATVASSNLTYGPTGTCSSNTTGGGASPLIKCSQVETAMYTISVVFPEIGSYTVSKVTSISQAGVNIATQNYALAVKSPPCGPLTTGALVPPCNDCEYICNKQYGVNRPTYVTPSNPSVTTDKYGHLLSTLSSTEQNQAALDYNACVNTCSNIAAINVPDECTLKAQTLMTDMSPGGQYFDNLQDRTYTCSPVLSCSPDNPAYIQSACIDTWLTNMASSKPSFWSDFYTFATTGSTCTPLVSGSISISTFSNWTWIRAHWQNCFAKYLIKFHPEYCNYNFYCNNTTICAGNGDIIQFPMLTVTSPGVYGSTTANSITMNQVNLYDKAFKTDNTNFFADPLEYPFGYNPSSYKSDLKLTPALTLVSASNNAKDPLFNLPFEKYCERKIFCQQGSYKSVRDYMVSSLTKFYPASVNGGSILPMSIWYVLDDPDGISSHTTAYTISGSSYISNGTAIDLATVNFFQSFHDPATGILSNPHATKYSVFRDYYEGSKQFVLYSLFNTDYECDYNRLKGGYIASTALTADANEPGFTPCIYNSATNTLPHAQIRFPKNDIFELILADCPNFRPDYTSYRANQLANSCQSGCTSKADGTWMPLIKSQIETCALGAAASNSLTVLANIRHDLIEICTKSCDATNTQGLDHIPSSPVNPNLPTGVLTFNDVINHYLGVAPYTSCPNLISNITLVNPQPQLTGAVPYSQASCICDNIKNYAINNSIIWNLSNPNLSTTIADSINRQLSVSATITGADVCAWMAQCYQGPGNCATLSTPPLNIIYLLAPSGSGVTNHGVPDAFICSTTNQVPAPDPCDLVQAGADVQYQNNITEQQAVAQLMTVFKASYIRNCLNKLDITEKMIADYYLDEYYYTLYYYDQAGNLIKTVPPEGFKPITVSVTVGTGGNVTTKDVALYRQNPATYPFVWPTHTLVTNYKYNTLNQLREQKTPDAGITGFYYDIVGRLIVSQNAKQALYTPSPGYSYTFYDNLSRITEVGEVLTTDAINADVAKAPNFYPNFVNSTSYINRRQITRTYYDEAPQELLGSVNSVIASNKTKGLYASRMLGYLRNRVSCVTYVETDFNRSAAYATTTNYYDNASHYSYDIHGNVKTLYTENIHLAAFAYDVNRVDYKYDLISGKVNEVHYNSGKPDQFHHRYDYDADNRITATYSSRNGVIWEKESKYFYYKHGPLLRTEIGDKQVQATDYAYTLHGWIKGVNSNSLEMNNDIGLDGFNATTNLNTVFARDGYGYSLGYFDGDYTAKKPSAVSFLASNTGITGVLYPGAPIAVSQGAGLYNGNIANMTTNTYFLSGAALVAAPLLKTFRYDQLNRIKNAQSYNAFSSNAWTATGAFGNTYRENFTYDYNGNITAATRYNDATTLIDDLTYNYYATGSNLSNNKLKFVKDNNTVTTGTDFKNQVNQSYTTGTDPDVDAGLNYNYDKIGNLIKDQAEQIDNIAWTVYGKIKSITRKAASLKPDLDFVYDAAGNRIEKTVKPKNQSTGALLASTAWLSTYYIRDAQGNVMATYDKSNNGSTDLLNLTEQDIYGSSRLGLIKKSTPLRVDLNNSVLHKATFNTSGTDGWIASGTTISVDSYNRLQVNVPASAPSTGAQYNVPGLITGKTYEVSYDIDLSQAPGIDMSAVVLDNPSGGGYTEIVKQKSVQGSNSYRFTARGGTTLIKFQNYATGNPAQSFYADNITVKEIDKQRALGDKSYELSNHLGNVLTVISDRKIVVAPQELVVYSNNFSTTTSPFLTSNGPYYTGTLDNGRFKAVFTQNNSLFMPLTTIPGHIYRVSFDVDLVNNLQLLGYGYDVSSATYSTLLAMTSNGSYSFNFTALSNNTYVCFENWPGGARTLYLDNVVIKDIGNGLIDHYTAEILSSNDYYAFGGNMPGRQFNSNSMRYTFNGKEADPETGMQDYGFRIYNPAIGKFLSVDPLQKEYPELTPYQFASNTPIQAIDLDGLEMVHCSLTVTNGKPVLKVLGVDFVDITGSQWVGWQYHVTYGGANYHFISAEDLISWAKNGATGAPSEEDKTPEQIRAIGYAVLMCQQDALDDAFATGTSQNVVPPLKSEKPPVNKEVKQSSSSNNGVKPNGVKTNLVKKDGASRAATYSTQWKNSSLNEAITKFAPGSKGTVVGDKMIYTNQKTGLQIVYDTKGNYFRIQNTSVTGKRNYTDSNGKIVNNKTVNGKESGKSQAEYNSDTHFNNTDTPSNTDTPK